MTGDDRGQRLYEAIIAFYGLAPGGEVRIEVDGDLAGDSMILAPDRVVVSGPDGVRVAQAMQERRPRTVTPEEAPQMLGEAARVLARAGASEATTALMARIAFRMVDDGVVDRQCALCGAITGADHRHAHELPGYPTHGHELDGYDCIPVNQIEKRNRMTLLPITVLPRGQTSGATVAVHDDAIGTLELDLFVSDDSPDGWPNGVVVALAKDDPRHPDAHTLPGKRAAGE